MLVSKRRTFCPFLCQRGFTLAHLYWPLDYQLQPYGFRPHKSEHLEMNHIRKTKTLYRIFSFCLIVWRGVYPDFLQPFLSKCCFRWIFLSREFNCSLSAFFAQVQAGIRIHRYCCLCCGKRRKNTNRTGIIYMDSKTIA